MDLAAIIVALVIGILTDELLAWSPRLAAWLVKQNAKRLPAHLRDRMCEEWLAHLDEIPGRFSKLVFAIDSLRATIRISWSYNNQLKLFIIFLTMFISVRKKFRKK